MTELPELQKFYKITESPKLQKFCEIIESLTR